MTRAAILLALLALGACQSLSQECPREFARPLARERFCGPQG